MTLFFYYLDEDREVQECGAGTWSEKLQYMDFKDRQIGLFLEGSYRVSTVFIGVDYPFETVVFNGGNPEHTERSYSWEEALKVHNKYAKKLELKGKLDEEDYT